MMMALRVHIDSNLLIVKQNIRSCIQTLHIVQYVLGRNQRMQRRQSIAYLVVPCHQNLVTLCR